MTEIRCVTAADRAFWYSLDRHMPENEFDRKVRDRQGYVLYENGIPAGILRYNMFWDNTPFLTLIFIAPGFRGKGLGRELIKRWEADMAEQGHGMVLTSTQTDESAQHFYRRLGYSECGCLILNIPGYEQPMEMFLCKQI